MRIRSIWEGTVPGTAVGRAFDSNVGQEEIPVAYEQFLLELLLALKGDVSTAAVAIETFADELDEYAVTVGTQTRILGSMEDLVALMVAYYGEVPQVMENTDGTGDDLIMGVRVPLYANHGQNKITHKATNSGQTNISNTELAVYGKWHSDNAGRRPVHAVRISDTTPGSAGFDNPGFSLPPLGDLTILIVRQTNPFADGNTDTTLQRTHILEDNITITELNAAACNRNNARLQITDSDPLTDLLEPYTVYDLRPGGLSTRSGRVQLQNDVRDTSSAVRYIPVIEMS